MLEPDAAPAGVVVLLHGLTDSPYSLRHVAKHYRDRGYLALGIRLPAHGTAPAALAKVDWQDWMAATRLAVREARRRAGPAVPFHVVGYSNGGALAVKYALDALEDPALAMPDRIVLVSPMIGVTAFARFAGVLGWPAVIPAFAKTAWLGIEPEYNPFKYNSFPINGARQSSLLSRALQSQLLDAERAGRLAGLPPIITFQSVVDSTVSVDALVAALYAHLPANGSELVLFDINRQAKFGLVLRPESIAALARLLPDEPRRYRTTVITNAGCGHGRRHRTRHRAGRARLPLARDRARLSRRGLFAVARRGAVPGQRRAVRPRARPGRGFRHPSRGARACAANAGC